MQAAVPLDPALCPLCGQGNRCAMEVEKASGVKQPPCWCTQVDFSAELLDNLPPPARGTACICAACARAMETASPPAGA